MGKINITLDGSMLQVSDTGDGKRMVCLKPGAKEGPNTALLSAPMTSGVHFAYFLITSAKEVRGGVFLGVAEKSCTLSRPLGDRCSGYGWGSRMPYVSWVAKVDDGWIAGRKYPHYKTRLDHLVMFRHDLYEMNNKQVQEKLIGWGLKKYLKVFAKTGADGRYLEDLTEGRMEADLGMHDPLDRAKLSERIKELFQEDTSYSQGDLVKVIFDADKGELSFKKCGTQPAPPDWEDEDAEWVPIGKPLAGLKGKPLCFACTVYHEKDKVEYRVGDKPPPALPKGPDLFAAKPTAPGGVYPSLSDWRFAQGKGSGEFASDDFTVIRHQAFGTTIELLHTADGSFQCCSTDMLEGHNMYHVLNINQRCDQLNLAEWRAPSVVADSRSRSTSLGLFGHQQGIEWEFLGKVGGSRAVSETCFLPSWLLFPERGKEGATEPAQLGYGAAVINVESRTSAIKLTLTASGFVASGLGGAVVCMRGKEATLQSLEEGKIARTVDDTGPEKVEVLHWRKDHMIVPPCPSSAQVRQELQTGGGADVVPIPSGGASCGNDPFSNYNYTAQRAWTASAIRREVTTKGWGQSGRGGGVLAEGNFDVCRRLDEMRSKAETAEKHADIRAAALKGQTGMTGYGPRKDKERALRLRGVLAEREARHAGHEKASRDAGAARFPFKGTGGSVSCHGPGQLPFGSNQALSSTRSRGQDWMQRVGRPGGSAGSITDPWGQKRWELKGEWLNLRPPIDRFKPTGA